MTNRINPVPPAPSPSLYEPARLHGHGATALAPGASDWLPPNTRITGIWTEDTPTGKALVYCHVRDTVRCGISLAVLTAFLAGATAMAWSMPLVTMPLLLALPIIVSLTAALSWVVLFYPETGPGGFYPVDAHGHLLLKANKPGLKGLTHHKL